MPLAKRTNTHTHTHRHFCVLLKGTSAPDCTANGAGLKECRVGKRAKFNVIAADEDAKRQTQGGDRFSVFVFTDDGDCFTEV